MSNHTSRPGYAAGHMHVRRVRGTPLECEQCGQTGGTTRNYNWASLTQNWSDPSDYIRVCIPCHRKMDDLDGATRARLWKRNQACRNGNTPYMDREWLRERYEDRGMSTFAIADEAQTNQAVIWRWMVRHEIPRRRPGRRPRGS